MYQVRHITCPLCEKGFAVFLNKLDYTLEGHPGKWEKVKCPKCDMEIFLSNEERYYLLPEDITVSHQDIVLT